MKYFVIILLTEASKLLTSILIFLSPLGLGFREVVLVDILTLCLAKGGKVGLSVKGQPG